MHIFSFSRGISRLNNTTKKEKKIMKTSKKLLALVLAAAMMVCMLAGCGGASSAPAAEAGSAPAEAGSAAAPAASGDKVIKIGVFEPASGDNGAGGKQETLGIQYANQECPTVEIGGETYTVELDIVDNQSSTDKAPSAAQQLVNDGCSIVLGSYGSGVSFPASAIFKNGAVPAIVVT